MLDLIEPMLKRQKLDYVRLDGSVPQKKRQQLVNRFQDDPRLPAVHHHQRRLDGPEPAGGQHGDQRRSAVEPGRAGTAHRPGAPHGPEAAGAGLSCWSPRRRIEESLLDTLSAKHDLALAALDAESDVAEVSLVSGVEELRRRLEVLLGAKPEAPVDETMREDAAEAAASMEAAPDSAAAAPVEAGEAAVGGGRPTTHRDRVAAAGGELLGAVFTFLGELVSQDTAAPPPREGVVAGLKQRLAECVEDDPSGRPRLSITLPNRETLDNLATTLARLLVAQAK